MPTWLSNISDACIYRSISHSTRHSPERMSQAQGEHAQALALVCVQALVQVLVQALVYDHVLR